MLAARSKPVKLEDVLGLLSAGFLRGGFGFLKSSSSSSSAGVNREIRVGVTHVSMFTITEKVIRENFLV